MSEIKTTTAIQSYKPKPPPPKGRIKGSKNKLTLLREAVLTKTEYKILDELPKIIAVVCKKAEEGDLTAAKLILERVIPVRKMSDGDGEGVKGPPTINIVIEGAEANKKVIISTEKAPIEDAEYQEIDEDE